MLEAPLLRITDHAVSQYRERVILCCERARSDATLRKAIAAQVRYAKRRHVGGDTSVIDCGPLVPKRRNFWEWKLAFVTYQFVIETGTIVTVLGYMMKPGDRVAQRARQRARLGYTDSGTPLREHLMARAARNAETPRR